MTADGIGRRVVVLGGSGQSTWVVANALKREFPQTSVLVERAPSRRRIVKRRAKRLGWRVALGQVAFMPVAKLLGVRSRARIGEILGQAGLQGTPPVDGDLTRIGSVNDPEVRRLLRRLEPAVVVVNGTRILSPETLAAVTCPVVNMHAGITPAYRGVHGGYWALVNADPDRCGVTVHLVDPGIDTGGVLYQAKVIPTGRDNFATYPFLQLAAGVPLLLQAVRDLMQGAWRVRPTESESRLWYHPTLAGYLSNRLRRRVK